MEKDKLTQVVIIGGSAGSLDAILTLLGGLKHTKPPAIVIVLHRKTGDDTTLTELLASKSPVPVKEAEEKEPILAGHIYLAPSDYHLLIEKDRTFSLDYSEKLNYSRPSIDVTFETAAEAFRESAAAILLSGANADGAEGIAVISRLGGLVAVQDPMSAEVDYMPRQALLQTPSALRLHAHELAGFLNKLKTA